MRTIVDLPEDQLAALRELCECEGISRAEAIHRAVCVFVAESRRERRDALLDSAFGSWLNTRSMPANTSTNCVASGTSVNAVSDPGVIMV